MTARYGVQVDFQFPDGGSRAITTALISQDVLPAGGPRASSPGSRLPLELRVDNAFAQVRAQISRTPTLSWAPPLLGSPTSYGITVFHLARIGSGPVIAVSEDAYFETTGRSLKIPFGELQPGEEYVFGVTAFDSPNAHVTKAPFKARFPFGAATALTALFRVDPTALTP